MSNEDEVWIGYAGPGEPAQMKLVKNGPRLFQRHFGQGEDGVYEIKVKELKGSDRITEVWARGILVFDAYKGVNRLDAGMKEHIKLIQPDAPLAKPEDIQ